jgi:hypothetical protein
LTVHGGLSPKLLQKSIISERLIHAIEEALNSMFSATIPREWHIAQLLSEYSKTMKQADATKNFFGPIPALVCPKQDQNLLVCCKCKRQIHKHSFTCHKGRVGLVYCRLCKPSGMVNRTKPVALIEDKESDLGIKALELPNVNIQSNVEKQPIVWELERPQLEKLPSLPVTDNEDLLKEAYIENLKKNIPQQCFTESTEAWLNSLDGNVLATIYNEISHALEERNGLVVEVNENTTQCVGCNTAAYLLGGKEQSHGIMFYLSDYLSKDCAPLAECLTLLHEARKHIDKYPSTAKDTGTSLRTAKHWITSVLNKIGASMEVSDTQCTAFLLNMSNQICSDTFGYFSCWNAMTEIFYAAKANKDDRKDDTTSLSSSEDDDSFIDPNETPASNDEAFHDLSNNCIDEDEMGMVNLAETIQATNELHASLSNTYAWLYTIDNGERKIPVSWETHYKYRGDELQIMNRMEYHSLVTIVLKKGNDDDNDKKTTGVQGKPGRKGNKKIEFEREHPLHASHVQVLCSKQLTCIFTGKKPLHHPGQQPTNEKHNKNGKSKLTIMQSLC